MSNGDRRSEGGHGGGPIVAKVKINLDELTVVSCPSCECPIFSTGPVFLKKLGAIKSPTGKPQLLALGLYICIECGTIVQVKGDELTVVRPGAEESSDETGATKT